jgi:hypothetical protein
LATGSDISNVTLTNLPVLNLTGTATMTAAQHNAFTGLNAAGGADGVVLTTVGTILAAEPVENYSIVEGSTITVGNSAAGLARVITETGVVGTVSTIILAGGVYTGDYVAIDPTDIIKVVDTTNVAGNTGLDAGAVIDFQSATATVTLNATQNGFVTFANAATGTQTIALSAVDTFTTNAAIEAYTGIGGGTITLATGHSPKLAMDVTAATTVNVGGQTVSTVAAGWVLGHAAADVINATTGANIAGVNAGAVTTAEALTLVGNITMTLAQYGPLAAAVTAAGAADSITLTTAGAVGTASAAVESYTLGSDAANSFTFAAIPTAATQTVNTTGSFAGVDTIAATLADGAGGKTYAVNLSADGQTDRISINNTTLDVAGTNTVSINGFGVGVVNDALNVQLGGVTVDTGGYTIVAAGSNTNILSPANSVIEITGSNLADLTADADGGAVEAAIIAAIGTTAAVPQNYTVVLYSGANAGIYTATISGAATDLLLAANVAVELVGIVNGVGLDAMTSANFF